MPCRALFDGSTQRAFVTVAEDRYGGGGITKLAVLISGLVVEDDNVGINHIWGYDDVSENNSLAIKRTADGKIKFQTNLFNSGPVSATSDAAFPTESPTDLFVVVDTEQAAQADRVQIYFGDAPQAKTLAGLWTQNDDLDLFAQWITLAARHDVSAAPPAGNFDQYCHMQCAMVATWNDRALSQAEVTNISTAGPEANLFDNAIVSTDPFTWLDFENEDWTNQGVLSAPALTLETWAGNATFECDVAPAPRVSGAEALTPTQVRVTFNRAMLANSELRDPANYTITADVGSAARVVEGVLVESPTTVVLELDGMLTVGVDNYNVQVDTAVEDVDGSTLDPAFDDADFGWAQATTDYDACEVAKSRLPAQFHASERLHRFICAFADRDQEIEQAAVDVLAFRAIDSAFGATLDNIGTILRLRREGLTDAEYRVRLHAQRRVIKSRGRPNELLEILQVLDNEFSPAVISLTDHPPAAVVMQCHVPANRRDLVAKYSLGFLKKAKAGGVKLVLEGHELNVTLFQMQEHGGPAPPAGSGMIEHGGPQNGGHMREAV